MRLRTAMILMLLGGAWPAWAEEVDRILAVAAGRAITWSAALTEANAHGFLTGQPPVRLSLSQTASSPQVEEALRRLTDRHVLERARERSALGADSPEAFQSRVEAAWTELAAKHSSPAHLAAALQDYGLDEMTLRSRLRAEQLILTFVDYSLRSQARVAPEQVAVYYQEEFLPAFQQEQPSAQPPDLEAVRSGIEEILTQQEINRLMGPWLEALKKEYGVRVLESATRSDP